MRLRDNFRVSEEELDDIEDTDTEMSIDVQERIEPEEGVDDLDIDEIEAEPEEI